MIVESLIDKKRIPTYTRDKVISLGDIAVYANESEVPLYEVLNSIKKKENGEKVALDISKAAPDDLRAYMAEVLPEFDRERVYPTDIKRLISWYNLLLSVGITDFGPKDTESESPEHVESGNEKETPKKASKAKNTTVPKTAAPKKTAATKQSAAKAKATQHIRQKQG
jgi:polyphosphate kinase